MAKISELPADEAKERLYDAYMGAHNASINGTNVDPHPSKDVTRWRAAAAGAPVGDTPPEDVPGLVQPRGADARFERGIDGVDRFTSKGRTVTGDAALVAHAKASNPSVVRGMTSAIKGYGRIK